MKLQLVSVPAEEEEHLVGHANVQIPDNNFPLNSPVPKFLSGFKLKGNLVSRQHLPPTTDIVSVICSLAVDLRDGVCAAAVRQRHPVDERSDSLIQNEITLTKQVMHRF